MGYLLNRPSTRALRLVREILGVFIGYIHIRRDMDVYMEHRSQGPIPRAHGCNLRHRLMQSCVIISRTLYRHGSILLLFRLGKDF